MSETAILDDHGFRVRGTQPTRADAFVDAAFAFAVTLLVIAIGHVPSSVPELVQAMRGVPAFAASFFLIARFWQAHRHWSRRYGIEDDYSVRLSLALVFIVLVYVYPLRMVATMVMAMVSGGVLAEQQIDIQSVDELRALFVTFAIGYAVVAAIFALLYRHALTRADAIGLSPGERVRTRSAIVVHAAIAGLALLSLLLALLLPSVPATSLNYSIPGLVYMLIYLIRPLVARREHAALAALGAERAA
ncbi:TMEM175 family protein [Dokdonella soli]|uniref:DUF1211 domain-containing protein n=1 Tax=Dokdonella soli TaxID=529810 RepID=A0ABN1INV9_9GAMM